MVSVVTRRSISAASCLTIAGAVFRGFSTRIRTFTGRTTVCSTELSGSKHSGGLRSTTVSSGRRSLRT